jgi:predicted esterase
MPQTLSRVIRFLALAGSVALYAQDASLALRTSVTYNTQRATLTLSDEQRKQAEQLGRDAQAASQAGKFGDAMRDYYQGMALMHNIPWTPAYEFDSSLRGGLDHAIAEPGSQVSLTLTPLFKTERAGVEKTSASLVLIPVPKEAGAERNLDSVTIDPAAVPLTARIMIPRVPAGNYTLEVRLLSGSAEVSADTRNAYVKALPMHVDSLSEEAQKLRSRIAGLGKRDGSALPTAAYAMALFEQSDRGEINPQRYNFHEEFAAANAMLDSLAAGRDPFAAKHGDFRKAYRSAVDQTLQPYRIFVPASYDGTKPTALVVALHGMGGDENSMFDAYSGTLKREAERLGLLVAAPKGRDTASMYRGTAEQDVMDVLAEVERDYRVDPARVYLMGHSMGGYGTWSVAINHPSVFAALGPISGGGNPADMVKIRDIPEYVVHGDDDRTVNVSQSRTMVAAGKKAGANITYVEVPGGSHVSVAAPQMGHMLDFFVKQSRRGANASEAAAR